MYTGSLLCPSMQAQQQRQTRRALKVILEFMGEKKTCHDLRENCIAEELIANKYSESKKKNEKAHGVMEERTLYYAGTFWGRLFRRQNITILFLHPPTHRPGQHPAISA